MSIRVLEFFILTYLLCPPHDANSDANTRGCSSCCGQLLDQADKSTTVGDFFLLV
jgi:hypothetical protein